MTASEVSRPIAVPPAPAEPRISPLALPIILAGTFMVVLDFFIVNVAVPSIQTELHTNAAGVQLIVAGYGLSYAAGLTLAGRLGDLFGRRRIYLLGLVVFTAASVVCGIAPSSMVLILARFVQGAGAALLSPQVLTLLGVMYTGAARARAFTGYGLALAISSVGGQLIGGLLIQADIFGWGWRTCFLINLPLGLLTLALTPKLIPESRSHAGEKLDLLGAVTVTIGLVAVVLPLVEGRQQHWPAWTIVCLVLSLPILAGFVWQQVIRKRSGRTPLIDMDLFRLRPFTLGLSAVLLFYAGVASFFLVLAVYLQQGRGMSAMMSGLTFTVMGAGFFVTSLSAKPIAARLGGRALVLGAALLAIGQIWLSATAHHLGGGGSVGAELPALVIDGVALGLIMAPLNSTVLALVPPQFAGAAAGVLTTMMQVGNSVGVAVIGVVFYGMIGSHPHGATFAHALSGTLVYLTVVAAVLALILGLMVRGKRATVG